jgi:hypothetical protein
MTTTPPTVQADVHGPIRAYSVRNGYEYGRILVDLSCNTIFCYSTYGSYNYSWQACGPDLLGFLTDLSYDYAMGKFLGSERELDVEASVEALKHGLKESYEDGTYTRTQWHEMVDNLEEAGQYTREEFTDMLRDGAIGEHHRNWHDFLQYSHGAQAVAFWENIWAPFITHVRELIPV